MKKNVFLLILLLANNLLISQAPIISSFTPISAKPGDVVSISGTGFNSNPADNIVYFGSTRATVTSASSNALTVNVPSVAKYFPISVLNLSNNLVAFSTNSFNPVYNTPKSSFTSNDFNHSDFSI
jgi:nitrous oxidase accessory protein NosD